MANRASVQQRDVRVKTRGLELEGSLNLPDEATAVVAFAHGSGSSRFSKRNRYVAGVLNEAGLATLLFDLLTAEEHLVDEQTRHLRFDIDMLARRLTGSVDWLGEQEELKGMPVGLFGASTGAAAALISAAERPDVVKAVVSRGGRPDLAGDALPKVQAPTLLIVGGHDYPVIDLNREASKRLVAEHEIEIVAGATHLFEEPDTLEKSAALARDWFVRQLPRG